VADAVGGQIPTAIASLSAVVSHIQAGRLIPLAVTDSVRVSSLPNVPAVGEFLPGFAVRSWHGVFAPAGTPAAIVDRLSAEIGAIVRQPEISDKLLQLGLQSIGSSAKEFTEMIRADIRVRESIIQRARIQPE
jgi:tripartite-type tricarboxylate transporter receptor subunit TctC